MIEINHNQTLARAAARYLRETGATNYAGVVFVITFDSGGEQLEVLVTTQKVGALTPHDLRLNAEAELETERQRADMLKIENAELRRDADRYKWLRERDLQSISLGGYFVGQTPQNIVLNGIDLDLAIDTEIKFAVGGGDE